MSNGKQGPLSGIRVLDFTDAAAGADGDVDAGRSGRRSRQDREPGRGENMRRFPPRWGRRASISRCSTAARRAWRPTSRTRAARPRWCAAKSADVVVEQFRPGVMDRLGLGLGSSRPVNPRIVYCAITGYGQSGPRRDRAGHDLNYIGEAGLLALSSGRPATGDAAGADRRRRRRRLSRGHEHSAGAAPARLDRARLPHRRQHGGKRVSLHVLGDRRRAGARLVARRRRRAHHRRLAALSPVRDARRQDRRRRRARAEVLGRFLPPPSGWSRIRRRRARQGRDHRPRRRDHRQQDRGRMAADLRQGRLLLFDCAGPACRARRPAIQGARRVRAAAGQ